MVKGLEKFKEHFASFEDNYVTLAEPLARMREKISVWNKSLYFGRGI